MGPFDFATGIDDQAVYRKTVARLAENGVALPTFAQLADPFSLPDSRRAELSSIDAVATDPAAMYETEKTAALKKLEWDGVDSDGAAQLHGTHLKSVTTDHVLETSEVDRNRMFNLGYYTSTVQLGGRATLSVTARRRGREHALGIALFRVVEHLQRSGGHQTGEVSQPRQ